MASDTLACSQALRRIEFSSDLSAGTVSRIFYGTKRGLTVRVNELKKL